MIGVATFIIGAPGWAAGLAALAIPVIVHLWSRRAGPPMVFPTIRFVRRAEAEVARRGRLRQRLLLATRCLLVMLIVAAFMQPQWRVALPEPRQTAGLFSEARAPIRRTLTLVVLDNSGSMQRTSGGVTLLDAARNVAERLIAAAGGESHGAMVIVAGDRPEVLLGRPTANLDALREALSNVQPRDGYSDMVAACRLAGEVVSGLPPTRVEAHVLTDAQAAAWPDVAAGAFTPITFGPVYQVRVQEFGTGLAAGNRAITDLRVTPAAVIAGQPATLNVDVANYANQAVTESVQLRGPFGRVATELALGANATASAAFSIRFPATGPIAMTATLGGDDALGIDDRLDAVVNARERLDVALLTEEAADDPASATYFVSRAIDPGPASPYAARVVDPASLDAPAPEIAVVLNGDVAGDGLRRWHQAGASLLWLGADASLAEAMDELLDLAPLRRPRRVRSDPGVTLGVIDPEAEVGRALEGPARRTLADLRFDSRLVGRPAPRARAALRWVDGAPALASRQSMDGRQVAFTAGLAPDDSDFARSAAFLPFLHELLRLAAPQAASPTVVDLDTAGTVSAPPPAAVIAPTGEPVEFTVEGGDHDTRARFGPLRRIGLYRVTARQGRLLAGVTARPDPRESDLARINVPAIRQLLSGESKTQPVEGERSVVTDLDRATPLWPWLALAAMLVAAGEVLLASFIPTTRDEETGA